MARSTLKYCIVVSVAKERPDVSAETLEKVADAALQEEFGYDAPYVPDCIYEALEEHILKEIERPSLKGPGLRWKLRRLYDKL